MIDDTMSNVIDRALDEFDAKHILTDIVFLGKDDAIQRIKIGDEHG